MADARRDQNSIATLLGVSSSDGVTPINVYVDPITHRLLVDSGGGGGGGMTIGGNVTGGTPGSVLFVDALGQLGQDNANFFWDNANKRLGLSTTSPFARLNIEATNIGTTVTDDMGILLSNMTAATVGNQQASPGIVWEGSGWKTNATAGAQDVRFREYLLPVQGAISPNSQLVFQSSINGAAYSNLVIFDAATGISMGSGRGISAGSGSIVGQSLIGAYQQNQNQFQSNFLVVGGGGVALSVGGTGAATILNASALGSARLMTVGNSSSSPAANATYTNFLMSQQTINMAATGSHYVFAQHALRGLNIVTGAATLANAATVYIESAAVGTGIPGNNYALWVDDGISRFDGSVVINAQGASTTFLSVGNISASLVNTAGFNSILNSSDSTAAFAAENTTASGSTAGSFVNLYSNDGAIMVSGDRLGGVLVGGSQSSLSVVSTAAITAFAEANWTVSTSFPTYLSFETVSAGSTTRTEKMRITASGDVRVTSAGTTSTSVVTNSATQTLSNKRINRRLATVNAPGATPGTDTDMVDIQKFTGLATNITSMSTNLIGTPVEGQYLMIQFLDNGTARTITWGASFAATTVALPTTTVISTLLRVGFQWSGSVWSCIAVA